MLHHQKGSGWIPPCSVLQNNCMSFKRRNKNHSPPFCSWTPSSRGGSPAAWAPGTGDSRPSGTAAASSRSGWLSSPWRWPGRRSCGRSETGSREREQRLGQSGDGKVNLWRHTIWVWIHQLLWIWGSKWVKSMCCDAIGFNLDVGPHRRQEKCVEREQWQSRSIGHSRADVGPIISQFFRTPWLS